MCASKSGEPSSSELPEDDMADPSTVLSPFKELVWKHLSPRERLRQSWAMRVRLKNPSAVHDRKLFPAP
jgi:hypothetical protein